MSDTEQSADPVHDAEAEVPEDVQSDADDTGPTDEEVPGDTEPQPESEPEEEPEDDTVLVNVLRRSGIADNIGIQSQAAAPQDVTLKTLRQILIEDGAMEDTDKFYIDGRMLGPSVERTTKFSSLKLKGGQLVIIGNGKSENVPLPEHVKPREGFEHARAGEAKLPAGDEDALSKARKKLEQDVDFTHEDPPRLFDLDDDARKALLFNSGVGQGVNISDPTGPQKSGLRVIEGVDIHRVTWVDVEAGDEDVLITYSARATAYAKSGWVKLAITAETPFVSGSLDASADFSETGSHASSIINVTGRYLFNKCQVTLSDVVQPTPELQNAVKKALDVKDPQKRTNELVKVFRQYGHVYVASVEMGGMKHTTSTRKVSQTDSAETFEAEMKLTMSSKFTFGSVKGAVGGGYASGRNTNEVSSFENETFKTVGGITEENNVTKWKASLANPANWSVTRTMRVESVIDLFDEKTRSRILASAPQLKPASNAHILVPLRSYAMAVLPQWSTGQYIFNRIGPSVINNALTINDVYTINLEKDPSYRNQSNCLRYSIVANVLSNHANGSVPFWRLVYTTGSGEEHFYTKDEAEKTRYLQYGARDEGVVCYVYPTQQPGTVPLYRLVSRDGRNHRYITSANRMYQYIHAGIYSYQCVAAYVHEPTPEQTAHGWEKTVDA